MGPVGRQAELEESAEPVKGKRGLIRRVSEDRGMAGGSLLSGAPSIKDRGRGGWDKP